jgi:hypothetical protein
MTGSQPLNSTALDLLKQLTAQGLITARAIQKLLNRVKQQPSLSTLSETLPPEMFTELEGEYGENKVEQQRYRYPAIVGSGGGGA